MTHIFFYYFHPFTFAKNQKSMAKSKEVVISNSSLNSHGFRVLTSGIDTVQFKRNPILLWMHSRAWRGTTDEVLPIGRIEDLRIEGDNLIGTPVFDEKDEFALKIKQKFENGFLKMVSPGLDPVETSDDPLHILQGQRRATVTKSKLIEVSRRISDQTMMRWLFIKTEKCSILPPEQTLYIFLK
ncbi:hypothetical protein EZS27_019783 [termite gut metagenome]|uniref:Uncharacterized protein n=1 Tax=termite gut metagenome TaxID=433724 RepID=A0A5J4RFG9_9ZZZZ